MILERNQKMSLKDYYYMISISQDKYALLQTMQILYLSYFRYKKHIFYHFLLNTVTNLQLAQKLHGLLSLIYLGTPDAGSITLEPCEITSSIRIKKVWLWWLAYVEGHIIKPTKQKHEFRNLALQILNIMIRSSHIKTIQSNENPMVLK